jgi:hypothetical protein
MELAPAKLRRSWDQRLYSLNSRGDKLLTR